MKRLPVIPTLVVALAVALMISLGIWQLHRATWKEQLLADYARNATLPAVDLDPLIANGRIGTIPLSYRRALVTCHSEGAAPQLRAGRNAAGDTGYGYWIPCRFGADGFAGRLLVNAGWAPGPNAARPSIDGLVAGTLGGAADSGSVVLTSARAVAPLQPSEPPSITEIPNNHMSYAVQWFFFAATAVAIYLLALRRRRQGR